jgi:hypothetical protein
MGRKQPRVKTSISLPGEDFAPFRDWCDASGRLQGEMIGRVLRWFVRQDKVVWRGITDNIEDELEIRRAYATVLRRMADDLEADPPTGKSATTRGDSIEVHAR